MIVIDDLLPAKDRLAASRAALMHEMGIAYPTARETSPATAGPHIPARSLQAGPESPRQATAPWVAVGKRLARNWWAEHPANAALTLARPSLRKYARAHPGKTLAYGAALGAAIYIVRPWRLLSLSTVAALVFQRWSVAGMVTQLADRRT